jgi:hypothetical protein
MKLLPGNSPFIGPSRCRHARLVPWFTNEVGRCRTHRTVPPSQAVEVPAGLGNETVASNDLVRSHGSMVP